MKLRLFGICLLFCFAALVPAQEFIAWGSNDHKANLWLDTDTKSLHLHDASTLWNDVAVSGSVADLLPGLDYASGIVEAYGFHTTTTAYGGTWLVTAVDPFHGEFSRAQGHAIAQYSFDVEAPCTVTVNLETLVSTDGTPDNTATHTYSSEISFGGPSGVTDTVVDGSLSFTRTLAVGRYWFRAETWASTEAVNGNYTARQQVQSKFLLTAAPVPEPASMSVLALGMAALIRRSRQKRR